MLCRTVARNYYWTSQVGSDKDAPRLTDTITAGPRVELGFQDCAGNRGLPLQETYAEVVKSWDTRKRRFVS